ERLTPGGQLDQTFGRGGKVTTDFGAADYEQALAIQLDGKLVVAGWTYNGSNDDFALARFNPDGTLDQTFGQEGTVTTDFASSTDQAYALAIQQDGRMV